MAITSKRHRFRSSKHGVPPAGTLTGTWRKRPVIMALRAMEAASVVQTVWGLAVMCAAARQLAGAAPVATTLRAMSVAVMMPWEGPVGN